MKRCIVLGRGRYLHRLTNALLWSGTAAWGPMARARVQLWACMLAVFLLPSAVAEEPPPTAPESEAEVRAPAEEAPAPVAEIVDTVQSTVDDAAEPLPEVEQPASQDPPEPDEPAASPSASSPPPSTASSSAPPPSSPPPSYQPWPTLVLPSSLPEPSPDLPKPPRSLPEAPPLPDLEPHAMEGDADTPAGPAAIDTFEPGPALAQSTVPAPPVPPLALAIATAATVGAGVAAGLAAVPGWRAALKRLLHALAPLALFTRLTKDDVLDHPRRAQLHDYVTQHPGQRVQDVRRALQLPNGVALHHLHVLSQAGLVRVHRLGGRRLLYPAGPRVEPQYVSQTQRQILDVVATAPGATQRDLGRAVGLSERAVSYHVRALAGSGLIRVEPEGNRRRCFAAITP
jgi:hypothetical protein